MRDVKISAAFCVLLSIAIFVIAKVSGNWDHLETWLRIVGTIFGGAAAVMSGSIVVGHFWEHRKPVALEKGLLTEACEFVTVSDTSIFSSYERRHVVRLVFMVTWYSVASVIALWIPKASPIMVQVMNVYEGFITFIFGRFLITMVDYPLLDAASPLAETLARNPSDLVLEDQYRAALEDVRNSENSYTYHTAHAAGCGDRVMWLLWPQLVEDSKRALREYTGWDADSGCFKRLRSLFWNLVPSRKVVPIARKLLVVYLFANPFLLTMTVIGIHLGAYKDGVLSLTNAAIYVYLGRLVFLTPALLFLVIILSMIRTTTWRRSPVKKFATVKIIVFIGVWQHMLLTILHHRKLLPSSLPEDEAIAILNNFFMCLETFVLGFINRGVFPAVPNPGARDGITDSVASSMLSMTDVVVEVRKQICG